MATSHIASPVLDLARRRGDEAVIHCEVRGTDNDTVCVCARSFSLGEPLRSLYMSTVERTILSTFTRDGCCYRPHERELTQPSTSPLHCAGPVPLCKRVPLARFHSGATCRPFTPLFLAPRSLQTRVQLAGISTHPRAPPAAQAGALRDRLGVRDGDRVALAAGNTDACLELLLAAAAAGAIAVPINTRWRAVCRTSPRAAALPSSPEACMRDMWSGLLCSNCRLVLFTHITPPRLVPGRRLRRDRSEAEALRALRRVGATVFAFDATCEAWWPGVSSVRSPSHLSASPCISVRADQTPVDLGGHTLIAR